MTIPEKVRLALRWWDALSALEKSRVRQRQAKRGEGPYVYTDSWWISLDDARTVEVHEAEEWRAVKAW